MGYLSTNLKFLRANKGLTQAGLAAKMNVKRSIIGAYEEERAEPKIPMLQNLAQFYSVSIDELLNIDLTTHKRAGKDVEGSSIRVLNILVNNDNKELITVVPIKAAAGYLSGYYDTEYIEDLPRFSLPIKEISEDRTYRIFQIKGDSMLPVEPNSYIISEYVQNWKSIKDNNCYIVITKDDGIVYKRVVNNISDSEELLLKSDNKSYPDYSIKIQDIVEVWKATGYISFTLPDQSNMSIDELSSLVVQLREDMNRLKNDGNRSNN